MNDRPVPAIEVRNLVKAYKELNALDGISLTLQEGRIHGLLGRNGAGKTTLMSILTGQGYPTSGEALIYGSSPFERDETLSRICFIRESQKYPDDFTPKQAFMAASLFFGNWNQELADRLVEEFSLPLKRRIKKLSRGQLSAVGVIIGMASRAEITFFDEPYLGLDAVARQIFYDRLVEDFSEYPRTIVLSSHLIDEIANLLEHVVVIDKGRIMLDEDAEMLRGSAVAVTGNSEKVSAFIDGYEVLHRDSLGSLASVTIKARLTGTQREMAAELGLELSPVPLQQLVVRTTLAEQSKENNEESLEALK
ncbi:ABC transporter ATP-binding protein [Paeniglutamicibacter kerguelensis]|uniref:ABC-2 type transport system ATP-binding protein n=1 Tax=Paeniglutamicibacter kerguelensis TaxID=254788 RepID=A0ABS4XAR9_9MICC|nr:ABC transporter ATP-binding protein [Paeniglutamicibacter kerguelensis]MBP2385473.1 ABC-2 type transport system ATP-binding protein [Paeniglutamicibacter kerguelensis]